MAMEIVTETQHYPVVDEFRWFVEMNACNSRDKRYPDRVWSIRNAVNDLVQPRPRRAHEWQYFKSVLDTTEEMEDGWSVFSVDKKLQELQQMDERARALLPKALERKAVVDEYQRLVERPIDDVTQARITDTMYKFRAFWVGDNNDPRSANADIVNILDHIQMVVFDAGSKSMGESGLLDWQDRTFGGRILDNTMGFFCHAKRIGFGNLCDLTTVVKREYLMDKSTLIHELIHNVCEPLNECVYNINVAGCTDEYRILVKEFSDLARRVRTLVQVPSNWPSEYLLSDIEMLPHIGTLAMWRQGFIVWDELNWFPKWLWQQRGIFGGFGSELGRTLLGMEDVIHRYIESRPAVPYMVPALERRIAQRQQRERERGRTAHRNGFLADL